MDKYYCNNCKKDVIVHVSSIVSFSSYNVIKINIYVDCIECGTNLWQTEQYVNATL